MFEHGYRPRFRVLKSLPKVFIMHVIVRLGILDMSGFFSTLSMTNPRAKSKILFLIILS